MSSLEELIFDVRVKRKNYTDAYWLHSSKEHMQQLASEVHTAERFLSDFCVNHEQELISWERQHVVRTSILNDGTL